MSMKWPGGLIRKTPVTPAGPFQNGAAPGVWSLAEAAYWTKQGLWPTAGNFLAVEDVFSTYLYTGNGGTQTITNGIDLAGKGGLVWQKQRNGANSHFLTDNTRSFLYPMRSNSTDGATIAYANQVTAFNSNGFTLGGAGEVNGSGDTYVSWTFRKAPKFFDVVTFSLNGAGDATFSHSLGVAPGSVFIKSTGVSQDWYVYHRSLGQSKYLNLNLSGTGGTATNIFQPTATDFTFGLGGTPGATYVAYLFAHDTSSTGLIQCGSFTDTATGGVVNLGWEPQWVLVKSATNAGSWFLLDSMRGWVNDSATGASGQDKILLSNTSGAESNYQMGEPTATGFRFIDNKSGDYIYIAIRRGPMRTPTSGTSVFSPNVSSAAAGTTITTNFPVDMQIIGLRGGGYAPNQQTTADRLRGVSSTTSDNLTMLATASTNGESSYTSIAASRGWNNTGFQTTATYGGSSSVYWNFRRAPSFFDEVCWKFDGIDDYPIINHNLGKVPELIIMKDRTDASTDWMVMPNVSPYSNLYKLALNKTDAISAANSNWWTSFSPTSTQFRVDRSFAGGYPSGAIPSSTASMVAYLFASCPGVSKVGSYTGTGTTQTINCGFTTGARFVLIKRTDSTGDWYVWDSARGIVAGNDPYLLLNSTAAEVTSTDYIDTDNSGFQISSTAPAAINANGGTFIYLAIS